jgi:hypothetical protein
MAQNLARDLRLEPGLPVGIPRGGPLAIPRTVPSGAPQAWPGGRPAPGWGLPALAVQKDKRVLRQGAFVGSQEVKA